MSATDFPWMRPRTIGLDAATLGKVRAYEAKHSLPGYPEEAEVSPTLRDRILAEIHTLPPLPPCEDGPDLQVDDWYTPDIACITCEDSGEIGVGEWRFPMPCPDCWRGDYTWRDELNDDARRGK